MFYRTTLREIDEKCNLLCLTTPEFRSQPWLALGAAVWFIGTLGNFYHHWLLMRLRSNSNAADQFKYKVPRGGLFPYVCCPHYLTELISWPGTEHLAMVQGKGQLIDTKLER